MPVAAIALSIRSLSDAASARIVSTPPAIRIFFCKSRGSLHPGGRLHLHGAGLPSGGLSSATGGRSSGSWPVLLSSWFGSFSSSGSRSSGQGCFGIVHAHACPRVLFAFHVCVKLAPFLLEVEKNPASLLLDPPRSRLGPAVLGFFTASALLAPSWVSVVRAAYCWWSSFRIAYASFGL